MCVQRYRVAAMICGCLRSCISLLLLGTTEATGYHESVPLCVLSVYMCVHLCAYSCDWEPGWTGLPRKPHVSFVSSLCLWVVGCLVCLMWVLGTQLKLSSLNSKNLTNWAISPASNPHPFKTKLKRNFTWIKNIFICLVIRGFRGQHLSIRTGNLLSTLSTNLYPNVMQSNRQGQGSFPPTLLPFIR